MATQLLEIQPLELKFTFEVKKQSSCTIQLGNKSDEYVAFKVKTTSPKRYCVRPNIGIIKPKGMFDFTVIMQAQKDAPSDMLCKDKFLIQSTIVPLGTTDKDITSNMFAKDKDTGKYVEEKKLRVVLISPPQSPVLLPRNGELKQDPSNETILQKDRATDGVENIPPGNSLVDDLEGIETAKDSYELKAAKDVQEFETAKDTGELNTSQNVQSRPAEGVEELEPAKVSMELKLAKDYEELRFKLEAMDSQLREAENTITKLTEERILATRENDSLKHELEVLRRKQHNVKKIQVGFPFLYVCMVAIISLALGYLSHYS